MTVLAASAPASAQQVVIFDETWTHTADIPDSHYTVSSLPAQPADFTSPVDYANGSLHFRLDVFTKPTAERTQMVFCWASRPVYSCSGGPLYTETGRVEWDIPLNSLWHPPEGTPDWSMGAAGSMSGILKDDMNVKISADNVGAARSAMFTPTDLRLVVTMVPAGATYVPPAEVDAGMEASDAGAADVDAGSGAADAGRMDAGRRDAGGASNPSDAGGDDPGETGGCSLSPRGRRSPLYVGSMIIALTLLRRARRSRTRRS